ncbi:transcriptional repressor LexA [Falsarthrobacter nasiphocae]|uniref:LexA repressor n=1 Tax=Falsarthrobacter nasiphocae TaxID=189863 RepID=A0AAE3YJ55_9MICC|nr:transcriptional repressor LexA [Falsarthrobacter nasiphocae]MDR6892681.1 repressor LexA [Falsarthrobacter nasiphocae]
MTTGRAPELTPTQRAVMECVEAFHAENGYAPSLRDIGKVTGLTSTSSVNYQLKRLVELGYIRRPENRPRSIEILRPVSGQRATASAPDSSVQDHASAGAPQAGSLAREGSPAAAASSASQEANGASGAADIAGLAPVTPLQAREDSTSVGVPLVGRIAAGGPILAEQDIEDIVTLPRSIVGQGELFMLKVRGDSMVDAAICDGDLIVVRRQNTAMNGDIVAALLNDEATVKTFRQRDGHTWLLPQNSQYEPILGDHAVIMGKVVSVLRAL